MKVLRSTKDCKSSYKEWGVLIPTILFNKSETLKFCGNYQVTKFSMPTVFYLHTTKNRVVLRLAVFGVGIYFEFRAKNSDLSGGISA